MIHKAWIGFMAFAVLSFVSGVAHAQLGSLFGRKASVPEISVQELQQLLNEQQRAEKAFTGAEENKPVPSFLIVDVRSDKELAVSIIPGAITKAQYEKNRDQYRGRTVIPYCTIGGRSGAYAAQLQKAGVKTRNFKGSILEWVRAELPLVTLDGTPTNRVHTYSDRYRVPAKYEAVTK